MRTLPLFLLTLICAALMGGISYAASVDDTKHLQNENEPVHSQRQGGTKDKNHSLGPSSFAKAKRAQQSSKNPSRPAMGNPKGSHQPLVNPANGTASGLPGKNDAANKARPVQPPSASRMPAPTPLSTAHHSPNPARVGGPSVSNARNSGAINGTGIKRRL
jgi:hypothetical protein